VIGLLLAIVAPLHAAAPPPIVGGDPSDDDGVVLLVITNTSGDLGAVCSGSRVAPARVLTAAHCVLPGAGFTPARVQVVTAPSRSAATGGTTFEVLSWAVHPDYDDATGAFDAALLQLEGDLDAPVLAVIADAPRRADVGEAVRLVGYGAVGDADDNPDPTRRAAGVPLYDFDPTTLYTWDPDGAVNACYGDSGGPMLRRDADGAWSIAAITGFVSLCEGGSAGGARADGLLPWLREVTDVAEVSLPPAHPDTGEDIDVPGGCGCSAGGSVAGWWALVAAGLVLHRRTPAPGDRGLNTHRGRPAQ
jgi:MYXO-CTERM domain-containing protein